MAKFGEARHDGYLYWGRRRNKIEPGRENIPGTRKEWIETWLKPEVWDRCKESQRKYNALSAGKPYPGVRRIKNCTCQLMGEKISNRCTNYSICQSNS